MSMTPPQDYGLVAFGGPGMPSFVRGDFDQDVQEAGLRTIWEQRYPCLCRSADYGSPTEQPDPLCLKCYGSGDAYHSPVVVRVVYHQPELAHNELVVWGDYLGGQAIATPRSEFILGHRDRLTVLDSLYIAEDEKERPEHGEPLALKHPIGSRDVEFQRLGLNPCIPEASTVDPENPCASSTYGRHVANQRVSFLGYPANKRKESNGNDHDAIVLTEGQDFTITHDGKIDLSLGDASGRSPSPGTTVTAVYLAHPVWIVAQYAPYAMQFQYQTEQVEEPLLIELPKSMKCEFDIFGSTHPKYYDPSEVRDLGGF